MTTPDIVRNIRKVRIQVTEPNALTASQVPVRGVQVFDLLGIDRAEGEVTTQSEPNFELVGGGYCQDVRG